ncbi:glycosyltransferase [Azospirillum halopraeferens]|uniref:glycosyltransferase family protein n=1 Tax=Azospirillum halopraeferens TaxID=34010 RepID=UPI000423CFAD|nr:glycosyltransferase [Azospirillum halopraeferens]
MAIALDGMGWEHRIVNTVDELEAFAPDAALCLHPQAVPKMTAVSSLGCHWNPPAIFWNAGDAVPNELSHDGFLTAGDAIERRLRDILWDSGRAVPTAPMYPSSQGWSLAPTLGRDSRFFYVGSNWDGRRFPALLETLARRGMLALHGQADRWKHLADAFMGTLPFDGRSVIERANACGMGLCLHLPAHFDAGIPNMRIFELCAAGALTVADRHPFIMEQFGDTVLYVDRTRGEEAVAEQILAHGDWARAHPAAGRDMARAAQEIFLRRFSLERLFSALPDLLAGIRRASGHRPDRPAPLPVSAVVPIGESGLAEAGERLAGLMGQTEPPDEIIVAGHGARTLVERPDCPVGTSLRAVDLPAGHTEGSALWAGARAATRDWVTWLPEGARPFPEHLGILYATAVLRPDAGFARVQVLEPAPVSDHGEDGPFHKPERPWRLAEPDPAPHPAGLLVRRNRLEPLLRDDPVLGAGGAWLLAQRLDGSGAESGRTTVRARPETALPPAERKRLEHFNRLRPGPAPAHAALPEPARLPWTGPSDLNPEIAEALPRLLEPADFARLPRGRRVYIYGASRGGELLRLELAKWKHLSVAGFLDGYRRGDAWGLPVCRPEDLPASDLAGSVIVIANQYVAACVERLNALPAGVADLTLCNAYPYIHRHCLAEGETA